MPVSIIHIADMHLGSIVSAFDAQKNIMRTREIEYTCISALKSASAHDVVLLSGDVFDSPDTPLHIADMFLDAVASCPHTRFFYSCGNHDPYISPVIDYCVQNCPPNLHIFGPEFPEYVILPELDVCVHGISFAASHQQTPLLNELKPCNPSLINLLCVHGELTESGSSAYNPISLSALEKAGFDYAALGHVHDYSLIRRFGSLSYAYPGVPEPRGFDECGSKGYICGTIGKNDVNLSFVPLAKRKYVDEIIDVSDIGDYLSLVEAVEAVVSCKNDIYRITLTGDNKISSVLQGERLASFCDSFHTTVIDGTHTSLSLEEYADQPTLKGQCAKETMKLLDECDDCDAELYRKACALLFDLFDGRKGSRDD